MFSLWTSGGGMYVRHWKVTTKAGADHVVTVRHQASTGWRQGLLDHVEMWQTRKMWDCGDKYEFLIDNDSYRLVIECVNHEWICA